MKIGIQGGVGSFSERAACQFVDRKKIEEVTIDYLISSENVLSAVEQGKVDYGIFAIENTQGGVVLESVYALSEHRCRIVDRFSMQISQNLLTLTAELQADKITAIHSHRQALRQCRDYLSRHFWGCSLVEADDTAESARRLSCGELPATVAVIANRACVEQYRLHLFAEDIQDLKNNLTMFLVVERVCQK